jgi:hypothetical protein
MNSGEWTSGNQLMKRSFAVLCALVIGVNVLGAGPSLAFAERLKAKNTIYAIVVKDRVNFYKDPKLIILEKEGANRGTIHQLTLIKLNKKFVYRVQKSGKRYYLGKSGLEILEGTELEICRKVEKNNIQNDDMKLIINKYRDGACIKGVPQKFSRYFANETSKLLQKLKENVCKFNSPRKNIKCENLARKKWVDISPNLTKKAESRKFWDKFNLDIGEFEIRISSAKAYLAEWEFVYAEMEDVRESIKIWENKISNIGTESRTHGQSTTFTKPRVTGQGSKPPTEATRELPPPRRNSADTASAESQDPPDQQQKGKYKSNESIWEYVVLVLNFVSGFAIIGTVGFFAWRAWAEFRNLREKVKRLGKDVLRLQNYVSSLPTPGLKQNNRAASDRDIRGRGHGSVADRGQAYPSGTNIGRSSVREKVEPRTVDSVELMEDYARALMEPHAMDTMKRKWQGVGATRYSDGGGMEEAVYLEMVDPRMFDEAEFWAFPYDNKGSYLVCPGRSVRKQVASLVADDGRPAKKKFGGILDIQGGTNFELKSPASALENGNMLEIKNMGILQLPAN